MAFTPEDHKILIQTHTTVKLIKEAHEKRLEKLEKEDSVLHKRITEEIKETNKRFGKIKFITAAATGIGSSIGAALAYLKLAITQAVTQGD